MIVRAKWPCFVSLLATASACGAAPAAAPLTVTPPPPEPLLAPVAAAEPTAPPAAPAPPPPPPVEFAVAVEGDCYDLGVTLLKDGPTVHRIEQAAYWPGHHDRSSIVFARLGDDDSFHDVPSLTRGLEKAKDFDSVRDLGGAWNQSAQMTLAFTHSRTGDYTYPYQWTAGAWHPSRTHTPLGSPYVDGARLVKKASTSVPVFQVVPKNHVTTPDFSALAATPKSDCEFEDGTMLARADGQVFVSGAFCAPDRATAVAWWRPGGAPARLVYAKGYRFLEIQEFVDAGTAGVFVVAAAVPDGVTAKTTLPFLGHFEDGSWAPVQLPFEDAAVESGIEVHAAHDGTLWVLANGTLFRRGTDAAWAKELAADSVLFIEGKPSWATVGGKRRVAHRMPDGTWHESGLPAPAFAKDEELLAESIQVDAHGEPWVRATYADAVDARRDRVAILRYESATTTHRPSAVWCSAERDVALGAWPALAGEACATPLPVLLRISRNAPETVDFPSVRKALAAAAVPEGVDLVEVTLANQRVLAAKVPSMAVGRSVVSAVEEGVEYSSPQLVCADAPVRRVLPPLAKGTSGAVSKGKTQ